MHSIKFYIKVIGAAVAALLLNVTHASADVLTREPDRYAFVTGLSAYTRGGSSFQDLPAACNEALMMREALVNMGWRRQNIFPRVNASGPQETLEEVRAALCDLTTERLDEELLAYTLHVIDQPGPSFSLVYLSGHGAENNGNQYMFGVDASIDFDREIARAQQSPNYQIFRYSAVNVLDRIEVLNSIRGKAALVIIDACRDNPVLDDFQQRSRARYANALSPINYISRQALERYDANFSNILVLFSTRPGRTAAGSTAASTSAFSQRLRTLLSESRYLARSPTDLVDEFRTRSFREQSSLPSDLRQIPQRIGLIAPRPVFCFWGCPQPVSDWDIENTEIVVENETPSRHAANPSLHARMSFVGARLQPAFYQLTDPSEANLSAAPAPTSTTRTRGAPDMRVDVFYCIDDELAAQRETEARAYAQALRRSVPTDSIVAGSALSMIRLRSLGADVNARAGYRRIDNSIWIDAENPNESEWSQRLRRVEGHRLPTYVTRSTTPNYISVFFCAGADPRRTVSTVYTQIPLAEDTDRAREILGVLQTSLPRTRFVRSLESVDATGARRSPAQTEVRYFSDRQAADAQAIAEQLSTILNLQVQAQRLPLPRGQNGANPALEIWLSPDAVTR